MYKLDERDIQILSILQEEGRITKTALADKLNLSLTPSWDRLQRLEEAGIIESYGAKPVSYTHLTLPTKRIVSISVVAVSLKKKKKKNQ